MTLLTLSTICDSVALQEGYLGGVADYLFAMGEEKPNNRNKQTKSKYYVLII